MEGSAWGNRDPQEGQQPFPHNPNGVGDRITTLRRLLIGAGRIYRLHILHFVMDDVAQFLFMKFIQVCKSENFLTAEKFSFLDFYKKSVNTIL